METTDIHWLQVTIQIYLKLPYSLIPRNSDFHKLKIPFSGDGLAGYYSGFL